MRAGKLTALVAAALLLTAPQLVSASGEREASRPLSQWYPPTALLSGDSEEHMEGVTPKDLLLSAALPGLGELRRGNRNRALAHLAAEAATWLSFAVFRVQGELRRDDYIEYARVYAGVENPDGQSEDYYVALGRYMRSDPGPVSYNEREVRETARVLFPDDLEARKRYIGEHEIHGSLAWTWESRAHLMFYRDLRQSSERSFERSRFCIAAAIANRIASLLGLATTRGPGGSRIDVGARHLGGGEYLATSVSLSKSF